MALPCPQKSSNEWKDLVASVGSEEKAYVAWFRNKARMPDPVQARDLLYKGISQLTEARGEPITLDHYKQLIEESKDSPIKKAIIENTKVVQTPEEALGLFPNNNFSESFKDNVLKSNMNGFYYNGTPVVILKGMEKFNFSSHPETLLTYMTHETVGHKVVEWLYNNSQKHRAQIDQLIKDIESSKEGWGEHLSKAYKDYLDQGRKVHMLQEWLNDKFQHGDPDELAKKDSLFAKAWEMIKNFFSQILGKPVIHPSVEESSRKLWRDALERIKEGFKDPDLPEEFQPTNEEIKEFNDQSPLESRDISRRDLLKDFLFRNAKFIERNSSKPGFLTLLKKFNSKMLMKGITDAVKELPEVPLESRKIKDRVEQQSQLRRATNVKGAGAAGRWTQAEKYIHMYKQFLKGADLSKVQSFGVKGVDYQLVQKLAPMQNWAVKEVWKGDKRELPKAPEEIERFINDLENKVNNMIRYKNFGENSIDSFRRWYEGTEESKKLPSHLQHEGDAAAVILHAEYVVAAVKVAKETGDYHILKELTFFPNMIMLGGNVNISGAARMLQARGYLSKSINIAHLLIENSRNMFDHITEAYGEEATKEIIKHADILSDSQYSGEANALFDANESLQKLNDLMDKKAYSRPEKVDKERTSKLVSDKLDNNEQIVATAGSQLTEKFNELGGLIAEQNSLKDQIAEKQSPPEARSDKDEYKYFLKEDFQNLLLEKKTLSEKLSLVYEHLDRVKREIRDIVHEIDLAGETTSIFEELDDKQASQATRIRNNIYTIRDSLPKDVEMRQFIETLKPKKREAKEPSKMKKYFWDQVKSKAPDEEKLFVENLKKIGYSEEPSKELYKALKQKRTQREEFAKEIAESKRQNDAKKQAEKIIEDFLRTPSPLGEKKKAEPKDNILNAFNKEVKIPRNDTDLGWESWQNRVRDFNLPPQLSRDLFELAHRKRELFDQSGIKRRNINTVWDWVKNNSLGEQTKQGIDSQLTETMRENGFTEQEIKDQLKVSGDAIRGILKQVQDKALEDTFMKMAKFDRDAFEPKPQTEAGKRAKEEMDIIRHNIQSKGMDPANELSNFLAKQAGFRTPSKEEYSEMVKIADEMPDAKTARYEDLATQMIKVFRELGMPRKSLDMFIDMLRADMLSSTNLGFLHFLMGGFSMTGRMVAELGAALVQPTIGGRLDSMSLILKNFMEGYKRVAHEWKNSYKTDSYTFRPSETIKQFAGKEREMQDAITTLKSKEATIGQKALAASRLIMGSTDLVHKMLSTFTQGWYGGMHEAVMRNEFMKEMSKRLSVEQIESLMMESKHQSETKMTELMNKGRDKSSAKIEAYEWGHQFMMDSIKEIMGKEEGEKISSDIQRTAEKEAALLQGYHSGDPGTFIGRIGQNVTDTISQFKKHSPFWGLTLTHFVRVPWNLMNSALWMSPYGFARLANYKVREKYFSAGKSPEEWNPYFNMNLATQAQVRYRFIEAAAGTLALGMMLMLRKKEGEENGLTITGAGPKNKVERDAWLKQGHHPYSIEYQSGDKVVAIPYGRGGLERFKIPAMMVGAMDDMELNHMGKDARKLDSLSDYSELITRSLFDNAMFLQGAQFPSANQPLMRTLGNQIAYTGSAAIPWSGLIRSLSKIVSDNPDTSTTSALIKSQIPITNLFTGKEAVNVLGDKIKGNPPDFLSDVSQRLFTAGLPLYVQVSKDSSSLYEWMINRGVVPSFPSRSQVEMKTGPLTDDQWHDYSLTRGREIKKQMTSNLSQLSKMDTDSAKKEIKHIDKSASEKAIKALGLHVEKKH